MTAAMWPAGVVARYPTAGGATVDLSMYLVVELSDDPIGVIAACTGCAARCVGHYYRSLVVEGAPCGTESREPAVVLAEVRDWAQDHAATCETDPVPGGVR
ncbi:hypothetical protein [Streptomyces sp. NPDC020983]|uniref:hypothetical protein n=1 Tax=Streptomyces sp. NPDC020983 TaxID=3365106 RepID=UPI0037AE6006